MELQQLIVLAQAGDPAACAAVCRRFQALVRKRAGLSHLAAIREEAAAEGWLALVQAIRDYDPRRGVPFAVYAERRVAYRIWNLFKRERCRWQHEQPLAGDGAETGPEAWLERLTADDNVEAMAVRNEQQAQLQRALLALPPRQLQAVTATLLTERKQTDLAAEWGVSRQAVQAMCRRALAQLRRAFAGRI